MDLLMEAKKGLISYQDVAQMDCILYLSVVKIGSKSSSVVLERRALPVLIKPEMWEYFENDRKRSSNNNPEVIHRDFLSAVSKFIYGVKDNKLVKSLVTFNLDENTQLYRTEQEAIDGYFREFEKKVVYRDKYKLLMSMLDDYNEYKKEKEK